jgi:hypothetical protein
VGTDGCSGCGMTGAVGSEACWEMKRREKMVRCSGCGMTCGKACWEMRRREKMVRCGVVVDVQSGFPALED